MSVETSIILAIEELCAQALANGQDQQTTLRAGAYVISRIKQGMIPNRMAAKLVWAAFADGFCTRGKLEGARGN